MFTHYLLNPLSLISKAGELIFLFKDFYRRKIRLHLFGLKSHLTDSHLNLNCFFLYIHYLGFVQYTVIVLCCVWFGRSYRVLVKDLKGMNYEMMVTNLLSEIDPAASYVKQRQDEILIMLRKKSPKGSKSCPGTCALFDLS